MDILKVFTRDEPIAGLEISDTHIRVALLEFKEIKKGKEREKKLEITILAEKPLKEGIVSEGEIKKKEEFIAVMNDLLKGIKSKIRYSIISISPNKIYSKLYSFPKTVSGEKLEEAMKLAIGFQLPMKLEDVYLDWEKASGDSQKNEIFLATASKKVIDNYIDALKTAGLNLVAIEFFPMSVNRAAVISSGPVMAIILNNEGAEVSIIENKIIQFDRFLPSAQFSSQNSFLGETRKIIDFFESEKKKKISEILLIGENRENIKNQLTDFFKEITISNALGQEIFLSSAEIKKDNGNKWLVALGAALRGVLPRSEDELISLMPIGTEEAYDNQKAIIFSEFISNISVALSIFFVVIFLGIWLLMVSFQKNFSTRIISLSSSAVPEDALALENRAIKFNELLNKADSSLILMQKTSPILEELKLKIISGISVRNFSMPSLIDAINISGVAQSRNQLNLFKKSLESSEMFSEVNLPLTNIELRENIPFSITFRIKDPITLNYVQ